MNPTIGMFLFSASVMSSRKAVLFSRQCLFAASPYSSSGPPPDRSTVELSPDDPDFSNYNFLIASVSPRPIALISTTSGSSVRNLSPYSFFTVASIDPPSLMVTCCRKRHHPDGKSDTLRNLEETGKAIVHVVNQETVRGCNASCGNFASDVDEIALTSFTTKTEKNGVDRLLESPIAMEVELSHTHPIKNDAGEVTATCCFLRVTKAHISTGLWKDGRVDVEKLAPISRMEGNRYGVTDFDKCFEMPRPAAPGDPKR